VVTAPELLELVPLARMVATSTLTYDLFDLR
jgi:hypothetical protein